MHASYEIGQKQESTKCFTKYFKLEYSQHKHQCATRYAKIAGINTNMYVEAFHQTLNYLYMKVKINRCVDKCVHLLMKIAKDKALLLCMPHPKLN